MEPQTQGAKLIRAKISDEEWAEIRKEAIDRDLTTGEWVATLLRAGRECVPPLGEDSQ